MFTPLRKFFQSLTSTPAFSMRSMMRLCCVGRSSEILVINFSYASGWLVHVNSNPRVAHHSTKGGTSLDHISQQDVKTFLSEMSIMRKHFGDAALSHSVHRNAVCEAVAFICA